MPVIHEYVNKFGFYIKSAHQGRITTYQVSKQGYDYLINKGYGNDDEIDINLLLHLIDLGYVYTKGNGPGDITSYTASTCSNAKYQHQTPQPLNSSQGCLVIIVIFFILAMCSKR